MFASVWLVSWVVYFFFNVPATTEIYTLSLHDALPIYYRRPRRSLERCEGVGARPVCHEGRRDCEKRKIVWAPFRDARIRSEEHTSELQSRRDLVCRLLLEKKKNIFLNINKHHPHNNTI